MKKAKFLFIALFFVYSSPTYAANASRSDTIDIRKTIVDFTIIDFVSKVISAKAIIDIKAKVNNVQEIIFDLEGLTVDSILLQGVHFPFTQTSKAIHIPIPSPGLALHDSALLTIFYHGIPLADTSWGGFIFNGNYAYQIGVGFDAQPHSFGRTWHPCFDNFVERSSYEFYITTENTKMATCNGLLIDSLSNTINNTITWHWKLNESIPSYLACVSVSNYTTITKVLNGNNGNTNANIYCLPSDTNLVHGSFANLQESFTMLENHFGTYLWPVVGYTMVPFAQGAMEHATNISIGNAFINGSLQYESLIAHELSHHWWGNLVTCSDDADMWLNEGFASYCEALHFEHVYGKQSYQTEVRNNHYNVLSSAHVSDDGYRSVSNMDSNYTYGATVYNKGSDMIHTLRHYMGDAQFFTALQSFITANSFSSISTNQLRDYLSTHSGINLTDYFRDWIQRPGFTHFSIDSVHKQAIGTEIQVQVFIRQRKHQSIDYYTNIPLELGFYDASMQLHIYPFTMNGQCLEFSIRLPFDPGLIVIDPDAKISDAVTEAQQMMFATGTANLAHAKCRAIVKQFNNPGDSTLIYAEHHWVHPDRFKQPSSFPGYVLNDKRYWRIDGIHLQNVQGILHFPYDRNAGNYYLDSTWMKNTEDSIRLFYRKDATEDWQFAEDSLRAGGLSDGVGNIYAKQIKTGEYTLGIKRSGYTDTMQTDASIGSCSLVTSIERIEEEKLARFSVYPNPVHQLLSVQSNYFATEEYKVMVQNMYGQIISTLCNTHPQSILRIKTDLWQKGLYLLHIVSTKNEVLETIKVIKAE
jgi:hypothetical protein